MNVVCLLQQHDPRCLGTEYGGRFPFQDALHEIFMCISEGAVGTEFDKSRIVRQGGISLIVQRRDVMLKTKLKRNTRYTVVPSTWRTGVSAPFCLTVFVESSSGAAVDVLVEHTAN